MGRPSHPTEFRRTVLDLLAEGRSVASVAHDLGISDQTIYTRRRQDRMDRGEQPGLTTAEKSRTLRGEEAVVGAGAFGDRQLLAGID